MRILVLIICALLPIFGFGQDANGSFELGNKAYQQNDYQNAIMHYTSVLDQQYSSFELHYNLGNAYFKNEQLGKAILHYEKAFKINNEDEDLLFNLNLSRSYIVDEIEELPRPAVLKWWSEFKAKYNPETWAKWALISIVLFSIILILRIFTNVRWVKKSTFVFGLLGFVLSSAFLAMSYISDMAVKKEAILIHTNTNVKNAPSENSENLFILHEGVKMQVLEQLNGWQKIKLSDGMIGWLPVSDLEEI